MVKSSSGMGLIHNFCMSESNKLNMLNQKKSAYISENLAFVLKNVIALFFYIQSLRDTHLLLLVTAG